MCVRKRGKGVPKKRTSKPQFLLHFVKKKHELKRKKVISDETCGL